MSATEKRATARLTAGPDDLGWKRKQSGLSFHLEHLVVVRTRVSAIHQFTREPSPLPCAVPPVRDALRCLWVGLITQGRSAIASPVGRWGMRSKGHPFLSSFLASSLILLFTPQAVDLISYCCREASVDCLIHETQEAPGKMMKN
jgi:hypothetical protein